MDDERLVYLNLSDEVLVALVVRRDVNAFSVLYDRYSRPVYAMAVYMLGHLEAEETTQEVFLRLWSKAEQFDPQSGSFRAWFMAIARHHIFRQLRQRSRLQQLDASDHVDQILATLPDPNTNLEEDMWLREQGDEVLQALAELPNEQRRVLVLAYFGGLSQSTIARYLQLPLGTVKKRTRLGLRKLRAALVGSTPSSRTERTDVDKDRAAHHDL